MSHEITRWALHADKAKGDNVGMPSARLLTRIAAVALLAASTLLGGCAVVSVASTAVSVGASAVGLVADAAVGTVKIAGKAVGAAADAVLPGKEP